MKVYARQDKLNLKYAEIALSKPEPAKAISNGVRGALAMQDALLAQLNAQEIDTNPALPRAHGRIQAQMQMQI